MNIGIPKEVRSYEYRVGLTPPAVDALVRHGTKVFVEHDAGQGAGFPDRAYEVVGAQIVYSADEVYGRADMVVKVTRPRQEEYAYFRPEQTILSFLHLAVASPDLLLALEEKLVTAIAYEMIQADDGRLPVLLPTSQLSGRLAPLIAGQMLDSFQGGRGILLSGLPGIAPAAVVILGAGVLGKNAARSFYGLGTQVTMLDKNIQQLRSIEKEFNRHITTMLATPYNIAKAVSFADVLIGAVSIPGERAPIVVTRQMVRQMSPRAAIIDFAIDSGGCIETSRPTNHASPTYIEEGVLHYCVPNVPARVARTASYVLSNAILPYLQRIQKADDIMSVPELQRGVNVWEGQPVNQKAEDDR
jgi:alanine dehydrogenase